jgi:hypothetical protein
MGDLQLDWRSVNVKAKSKVQSVLLGRIHDHLQVREGCDTCDSGDGVAAQEVSSCSEGLLEGGCDFKVCI